jgi:hypothetical protein
MRKGIRLMIVILTASALACGQSAPPAPPPPVVAPAPPSAAEVEAPPAAPSVVEVGFLNAANGWNTYNDQDNGTTISLVAALDDDGKEAMQLNFDMARGLWCGAFKPMGKDLSSYKGLRFRIKGTGAGNTIEFKLEDADGSNFGRAIDQKTNVANWTTVDIPFASLQHWWSGDDKLALADVKIHFAIAKKETDPGGAGSLTIAGFELY